MGTGGTPGTGGMGTCPDSCDDQNPCTTDTCDASTGFACSQLAVADGIACDDGDLCTNTDSCKAGRCAGLSKCPRPVNSCQPVVCDPAVGVCSSITLPDGAACNDGDLCYSGMNCAGGLCTGGVRKTCPPAVNTCEINDCLPFTGECFFTLASNFEPCNVGPACSAPGSCFGSCLAPPQSQCDACEQCTAASCAGIQTCEAFLNPADQQHCRNLYECFLGGGGVAHPLFGPACISSDGDPIACYCGTHPATCRTDNAPATRANGACVENVWAAAGTNDAAAVWSQFRDLSSAVGRAVLLAQCRATSCASACLVPVDSHPCTGPDQCKIFDPVIFGCVRAAANGKPCDDGNSCTMGDNCQAGACSAGPAICSSP